MQTGTILEGIKVVDFSRVGTGPVTTRYLADFGATVVRVESSVFIDLARAAPPMKDSIPGVNRAGWANEYNRNKYGMALNMRDAKGRAVARKLVAWADVCVENFVPGAMGRLGLGYEDARKINPSVIMFSTSIQGSTGPHSTYAGYGVMLTALAGFTHLTGWPDRPPVEVYGAYTDWLLPPVGVIAILSALDYRRRTGKGLHIDASQFEVGVNHLAPVIAEYAANGNIRERTGSRSVCAAPHNVYRCSGNDRWCAISVLNEEEWGALCQAIGRPDLEHDPRFDCLKERKANEAELDVIVEQWTKGKKAEDVVSTMQVSGVRAGLVATAEDLFNDPQLQHREHFHEVVHPEMGRCRLNSPPFLLSKTPPRLERPGPCLGEHIEYVCTQILGMSDAEFLDLADEQVFV